MPVIGVSKERASVTITQPAIHIGLQYKQNSAKVNSMPLALALLCPWESIQSHPYRMVSLAVVIQVQSKNVLYGLGRINGSQVWARSNPCHRIRGAD